MNSLKNPVAASFLEMTAKELSNFECLFDNISIGYGFINVPNRSHDAGEFLNENRKPNPEAKQIVNALETAEATFTKAVLMV